MYLYWNNTSHLLISTSLNENLPAPGILGLWYIIQAVAVSHQRAYQCLVHNCGIAIANALELPQACINSLCPSDAIWQCKSGSTLAQVMACCLMSPEPMLTHHLAMGNFTEAVFDITHYKVVENYTFENTATSPRVNELSHWYHADGLVQERRNYIANALELRLSCTNPWMLCLVDVIVAWSPHNYKHPISASRHIHHGSVLYRNTRPGYRLEFMTPLYCLIASLSQVHRTMLSKCRKTLKRESRESGPRDLRVWVTLQIYSNSNFQNQLWNSMQACCDLPCIFCV